MTTVKRGTKAPARWRLLLCAIPLLASCSQEPLTAADPHAEMPVPTRASHSSYSTSRASGIEIPFRIELKTQVAADLSDVLAFYRAELGKRGWQEMPDGTMVAADRALLVFASPKGPGTLTLDRAKGETMIDLVQRNTEVAARANFLPIPGQARLIFGYLRPNVASLAINDQTIEIAGGENHPQTLDLPPGTYPYELRAWGRLLRADTVTLAAGEAWSLSDDKKPSRIY
ncbi:hypothetical protein G8O24_12300 [Bradyrhizobium sp. INPA01-394B]|uniref:Lipoprotein n=1 Tax=Bradyrhizobium campsiandrae TaxID=1729892 RepID=A0ABR7UDA3_9BRAD|nr:hypothetical protein [Bradyrhizobium campsiandrae]MBC9878124.1 hypothetical protein [Bradyrhizobium campsiandrae]MBC9981600.1 hypothetical protein [Bradyrhizobium campsiandrae]